MLPRNRWLVLALLSSALFLISVDMTVLYTALPRLTHDLGATATEKLWIVNAYPLVVAGLLPGLGTLGDRLTHKRMFLWGLAVFGLASLWAAFSPTPGLLIGARVGLAVGAALMMPATLSLIRLTFTDEKERAFAIGVWAAVASGGAALGPVLGGLLLEHFWWGSVFLLNVPVVAVALLAGPLLLPRRPGNSARRWDMAGSAQVMVGIVAVVYGIKEIARADGSLLIAGVTLACGGLVLTHFVRRQLASPEPLIDFRLMTGRRFSAGVISALVASAVLVGIELVYSQHLQLVRGFTPLQAGLMILPIPLASFAAGPLAGLALPRMGGERVLWLSLLLSALGLGLFVIGHDWLWIGALAVLGFGLGATMTAASSIIMLSAPEDRAGMAASIEEVSFELGSALGVAVLGGLMAAIYTRMMTVPAGVPQIARDGIDEALILAENLEPEMASRVVLLAQTAFDRAFDGVVVVAAVLMAVVALLLRWRVRNV
ncbi:MFS transporter [Haematobacter massiliensis]|uniref:MFS transporter n=1 Tax=Haematobacter massiliensis TaxID=195105 RepID=A0A086Y4Y0_9RHOB|nr:MFS transporter [Haematobacter massiliensis]KFI29330.1 MFS transporter [Haematobacter massiliensis]OWJ83693.1 MFS transporter [Haematobacter massiliensis]QBJ25947.1 MFS transporter [Haematobacter massiliensis]